MPHIAHSDISHVQCVSRYLVIDWRLSLKKKNQTDDMIIIFSRRPVDSKQRLSAEDPETYFIIFI